jgi:HAE1 family hydrophobic/amphiphilic exporter-1
MVSLPQLTNSRSTQYGYSRRIFRLDNQEYTVRLKGEFSGTDAISELEIPTAFGSKKIRQFAEVKDAGKEIRQRSVYFNNKTKVKDENVIRLGIVKSPEGNIVNVANAIRESLPDIIAALPEGCNLEIINDESDFVKSSADDTMSNIYLGILFTSLVLFFFLHDIRSTFIIALSMPASIISTFLLLNAVNLSLNMMTLMGLSVSIGVLVANSIVVLENVFRHRAMGKTNKEAAYDGTAEVTVAVLAATLTNLVVFIPIASMSSIVGQYLKELALAATFATLFSLLFSFTLTPMLASLILPKDIKKKATGKLGDIIESWLNSIDEYYRKVLKAILKNRKISGAVLGSSFVLLIIVMMIYGPRLGFEFLPFMDNGKIKVEIELPEGYNLEATAATINEIEKRIEKHPEVKHIITDIGKLSNLDIGANMAKMDIQLVDVEERDVSIHSKVNTFTKEFADIPNAKIKVDIASEMGEGGAPIQLYLLGQDLNKLEEYKNTIWDKIKDVPGLTNFDQSSRAGKPEITIYPDRKKISEAGLTVTEVALTVRSAIEGLQSTKYREFGNEYDITVTLEDDAVDSPEKIGNIVVVSPVVGPLRISQIADVRFTTGYTRILHRDKYTSIMFTGSPAAGVPTGDITSEINKRLETIQFEPGYSITWGGNVKMMNEMVADMVFAFLIAVILTYLLIAALLESFVQPIPIMLTLPLALIGVVIFMFYTNTAFGISSLMGVIMLIGLVVNNAILMLDYTNQLRREQGMSPKDALIEACPTKLRPVIMSTLALILGMLPMALGIGSAGSEMRTPLGIVSIGGLIASAFLTLLVIPSFYFITSRDKKKAAE